MKKRIFAVALVVMMLAGGLVLMSCSKCPGEGDCYNYDASMTPTYKWCGSSGLSKSKAETAADCAANSFSSAGKKECDC